MNDEKVPMIVPMADGSERIVQPEDKPNPRFVVEPIEKFGEQMYVILDRNWLLSDTHTKDSDEFVFTKSLQSAESFCQILNRYESLDKEIKRQIKMKEKEAERPNVVDFPKL